jgi:hypothetical protein
MNMTAFFVTLAIVAVFACSLVVWVLCRISAICDDREGTR